MARAIRGPPLTFTSKSAATGGAPATARRYSVSSRPRAGHVAVAANSASASDGFCSSATAPADTTMTSTSLSPAT